MTGAPRAVVDVNLLVRGILSSRGRSAELITALKRREFISITSRIHLLELNRVLAYSRLRKRYGITKRRRQRLMAQIFYRSACVSPLGGLTLCRDPKDDYLIEMALLGKATHLVTEDEDLLKDPHIVQLLAESGVKVCTLREFLGDLSLV